MKNIKLEQIQKESKKIFYLGIRYYNVIIIVILLIVAGFSGYLLYEKVYSSGWTESRQQEYINSRNTDIKFQDDKFKELIKDKDLKEANFGEYQEILRDIFY